VADFAVGSIYPEQIANASKPERKHAKLYKKPWSAMSFIPYSFQIPHKQAIELVSIWVSSNNPIIQQVANWAH
jgi:hypothetical protein